MAPITPPGDGFFNTNGVIKTDSFLSPSRTERADSSESKSSESESDAAVVAPRRPEIGGTYQNEILKAAKAARDAASAVGSIPSSSTPPSSPPPSSASPESPASTQPVGTPIPIPSTPSTSPEGVARPRKGSSRNQKSLEDAQTSRGETRSFAAKLQSYAKDLYRRGRY